MWTFNILAHSLSKDGILVDSDVYSGALGEGFDDPTKEAVRDEGPIPEGFWKICGPPYTDKEHGPYVLRLEPEAGTQTYGRVGFLMHGKPLPPKDIRSGSKGCICAGPDTRRRVYQSADTRLEVISGIVAIDPEITT
jgi:hypothetical protein